jgi:4-hydroxy-tetrahydrodipicolinate synthase
VVSNVAPRLCAELQSRSLEGDFRGALAVQDRLVPLHDAIFLEPGLAGAKAGLALLGRSTEEVRLPLRPVTAPTKAAIRAAMVHAGLINA